jgi:hypothetical protein
MDTRKGTLASLVMRSASLVLSVTRLLAATVLGCCLDIASAQHLLTIAWVSWYAKRRYTQGACGLSQSVRMA